MMDEICSKAKALNSTKSANSQNTVKVVEEMTYNINVINEIFDDFNQGSNFYNNLALYLGNLQKIVADYYLARDIDKKNRLQELEASKACSTFNNSKPFFSEETGQFPTGTSAFRPSGAKATYQNLNDNLGTAFNPTVHIPQNIQTQTQFVQPNKIGQPQPTQPSNYFIPQQQQPQPQQQPQYFNQNASSQYGYMPFQNIPGSTFNNFNNAPPPNNSSPFGGFNETTSSFVPNPFQKK